MSCRVKPGKFWITIEDPFTTPGAHQMTVEMLSVTAGVMFLGLVGLMVQCCRRGATPSDALHIFFFLMGTGGYACAGIARAAYTAGPNPLLLTARLLLVTSWLGLLANCCLLFQQASASTIKRAAAWSLSACLVVLGWVAAAAGWGSDLQFAMLFMAGMAAICTAAWFGVYSKKAILRAMCAGFTTAGSLLVGIMEPFCGSLGHSSCYSSCADGYVLPWIFWIAFSICGHGGIAVCQMHAADDLALPNLLFRKAAPPHLPDPAPLGKSGV